MKTTRESRRDMEIREKPKRKREEEWCWICYGSGGRLMHCDEEKCGKVYHPRCVGKDDLFVNSGEHWTCEAHSCFSCRRDSSFNCTGCTKALCKQCIGRAEFVQIKGNKGLCSICLRCGLLVEEKNAADYEMEFMFHFSRAWKIITERECLSLEDLRSAKDRMMRGDQVIQDVSASSERTKTDRIILGNDEAAGQEKAEGSTAKVTEGNEEVEDNGQPSVPLDDQDPKWSIITPKGAVSGPYLLDGLKCIREVLPYYSQFLMVCKEASRDAAVTLKDAFDQENTENSTANVTEGNERIEDNVPPFDEQLEAILKNLPERYISATKLQPSAQNLMFTSTLSSGNERVEDNGPPFDEQLEAILSNLPDRYMSGTELQPSVKMNEQDPKWNILVSARVVKGPYSLRSLKCVHDISASSSQYLTVWKDGESKNTAIKLPDAVKLLSQKKCDTNTLCGKRIILKPVWMGDYIM